MVVGSNTCDLSCSSHTICELIHDLKRYEFSTMQDFYLPPTSSVNHYRIGSLANPRRFKEQDFESLRNYQLSKGQNFKDDTFPANISIIGPKLIEELRIQNVEWRRPKEICKDPHLFVDGASLFDLQQTYLGNCWVLSTMGALALKQTFLWNVIPCDQGYSAEYAGIFHFRFWHFGEWVDVVIDDQLPFINGKYLSVQPCSKNEFWPCLLEKAYAKLQGSYQNLHWGDPSEAFVNFSGGVAVSFNLKDPKVHKFDLWKIASLASRKALMGATVGQQTLPNDSRRMSAPNTTTSSEDFRRMSVPSTVQFSNTELINGLVQSHAYTVTGTTTVHHEEKGPVHLIRLWNPWCKKEWNGPWSDNSPEWSKARPAEQKKLLEIKDNGEFWMPWEHFKQEFSNLYISNCTPDFMDVGSMKTAWYRNMFFGHWCRQTTPTNNETLWQNPQFLIRVTEKDEVKTGHNVVVALMQNPDDRPKFMTTWQPIGFKIILIDQMSPSDKMPQEFFSRNQYNGLKFYAGREYTSSLNLPAGNYVLVPFTVEREKDATFMLRIFLKSKDCAEELGSKHICRIPRNPEENIAEQVFSQYADMSLRVNAWQLQRILNDKIIKDDPASLRGGGFSLDASRGILAVIDYNMSGSLDVKQFHRLWNYLNLFKVIFRRTDEERSGFIDRSTFQWAARAAELNVNKEMLQLIFYRYGDSSMRLNLIDFLCCMIRFKSTSKTLRFLPTDGNGVYLSNDLFLKLMMYS
ncbi:hypothetical protein NDU88_010615 [Pleurodeles waltl]|uniref:Calpain catalytic domain-containing protein n=1 Tax=Pleurodeles waltl TaxID=8319 RepID=A0AAV7S3S6_PLEWA|nr:hypothetical protein NDU88_010615 [Pleurodeles waltl]